jgi:hypothetical protein
MDGRLICSSAVCRRDWSARRIVPGAQKSFRTRSKSVVLSGFPTALQSTLRRLALGTTASTLLSEQEAGQLLLSRNDIPPPCIVGALEVCRLRLARIYGSSCPSSSLKGALREGLTEFFLGGIKKSIVTEGKSGVMCDLQRMKSGKKLADGLNRFLPILRKPPM